MTRGFVDRHVEERWVLDLPWHGSIGGPAVPGGYRIRSWAGACPEDLVGAYAGLRSAMARDVPTGDLTHEPPSWDAARVRGNEARTADRYLAVVSLAQTAGGDLAGYTLVYLDLVIRTTPARTTRSC